MATNPTLDVPTSLPGATGIPGYDANVGSALGVLRGAAQNPYDITQTSAFQQLQSLLGPSAGGGLSAGLAPLYGAGMQGIQQTQAQNLASARTQALGRGLEGSTADAALQSSANFQAGQQQNQLLASLFGLQNQNVGQLASYLYGGAQNLGQQYSTNLQDVIGLLQGAGSDATNYQMYQNALAQQRAASNQQFWSSLLGGGLSAGGAVAGGAFAGGYI